MTDHEATLHEPNSTCSNPDCGYRMWVGEIKSTVECSFIWFCPVCHYEMRRDDALGQLEAELMEPKTFEQFQAQPNVIGTIHAKVEDDE